jgi:hypothetical protein
MNISSPVKQCNICLQNAGFNPPAVVQGAPPAGNTIIVLNPPDPGFIARLNAYLATASPCAHTFTTAAQTAAGDAWAVINAKLNALPAAPGAPYPDPYATIRARLTADLAAALTAANAAGGLA